MGTAGDIDIVDDATFAKAFANLVKIVENSIKLALKNDGEKREAFTQEFAKKAREQYPNYNVVIIHTPHDREGVWIHQHHELPMTVGTCGYEVYFSRIGDPFSLTNNGDGGYINWAFIGYNRDGNRISAPSASSTWESLGGGLTSDPAAVSWGDGRIDVFARADDNAL